MTQKERLYLEQYTKEDEHHDIEEKLIKSVIYYKRGFEKSDVKIFDKW